MAEVSLILKKKKLKKKKKKILPLSAKHTQPPLLSKIFAYACLYYEDGWKKLQKQNETFLSHTAMSIFFYSAKKF